MGNGPFPFAGEPDRESPTAVIQVKTPAPRAGEPVALDASASFDNQGIVFFAWDLDHEDGDVTLDPTVAFKADTTGQVAHFTPAQAGAHSASLLVVDAAGNTDRVAITVEVEG